MGITIHVHGPVHIHQGATAEQLAAIDLKLEELIMNDADLQTALAEVKTNLVETAAEFDQKLTELAEAIANSGQTSPATDALVEELRTMSRALADRVPNVTP